MTQAKTLSAVIGEQVRAWREAAGLRQDEVARAARERGLDWTRATVALIEGGRRQLTVGEFAALPFLVAGFPYVGRGRWRRLLGFIGTHEPVALTPDARIRGEDLAGLLSGWPVLAEGAVGEGEKQVPERALYVRRGMPPEARRRLQALGDAELKAAQRLGVSWAALTAAALRRWGRTLSAERDRRVQEQVPAKASPRTLRALRGHVTRALLRELRPAVRTRRQRRKKGGRR